ncbi:protein FAM98B-like [Panicum virgatum]|uniref:protein FAM98B-like n=1 Tax=Panicum virgatum TaxID=38727 RepID=UPI0019D62FE4|nr:protein FAM98B-like [Panicum virgatum]
MPGQAGSGAEAGWRVPGAARGERGEPGGVGVARQDAGAGRERRGGRMECPRCAGWGRRGWCCRPAEAADGADASTGAGLARSGEEARWRGPAVGAKPGRGGHGDRGGAGWWGGRGGGKEQRRWRETGVVETVRWESGVAAGRARRAAAAGQTGDGAAGGGGKGWRRQLRNGVAAGRAQRGGEESS